MFHRFAAGTAVASVAIALAALVVLLTPSLTPERTYPLTLLWCCAPFVWGVWAVFTPSAWMPRRLPLWGAILGVVAGSLGAFVLDLPSRLLGAAVPLKLRGIVVLILVLFYSALWMLVRVAYEALVAVPEKKA
jgi:hypothetical protein